jgi:lyso-ornithine lipid O-acyltransferase
VDFLAGMRLNVRDLSALAYLMEIPPASWPKRIARVMVRGSGLAWGVVGCLAEYLLRRLGGPLPEQTRIEVLHRWSRRTLPRMGVAIEVSGSPPGGGLIASNHLSYLDILVYSAIAPCAFVSKREVQTWPAVGWIATLAGTIYVDRSSPRETHAIQPEIQSALACGLRLFLFPEGTSSDGASVLRFHSSLFQPAVDLQAQVSAASISYAVPDGNPGTDACYWGSMTLFPHLIKLLGRHSVTATVKFSMATFRFDDRKQAAEQMHQQVEHLRQVAAETGR